MSFDFLIEWNQWIVSHKELVTVVAIPLLTAGITVAVNRSVEARSTKAREAAEDRAAKERRLQLELSRRMKLADFRQNWIDNLREDFAAILAAVPHHEADKVDYSDVNTRIQRVLLRMNPREEAPNKIFDTLMQLINERDAKKKEDTAFVLTNLVNRYLKLEWDRLKVELSDYKKLEEMN
ncbi:hypothetical protein D1820_09470 [Phaeobacter sp. LSS9]|uniref:hypothetical protein n=1 Tax=unclassified Phaeobacter TaxID=2621772 RepID=UPI000E526FCF|nr:hypothetical protein [Phaeobacter sp. LSS9]AXT35187.1 hypothetical protein D1820_09470 [Phaeobacter sp. LSS9]